VIKEQLPQILILVVEDEDKVNRLYGQALEQSGFSVHQVRTGEEAIEVALHQTFDVAVIDLRLPGKLDGLTTLRVLKILMPELKGIVITGYGNRGVLIEALKLGVDGWLEKPVTVNDLVEAVKEAVSSESRGIHHQQELQALSSSDKSALLKLFLQMLMATTVSNVGILWVVDNLSGVVFPQIVVGEQVSIIPSVPYKSSDEWLTELRTKLSERIASSCLIVPIKWQRETLGAVGLCRYRLHNLFYSQSDLNYLERFAEWLAPILLSWLYPMEILTNLTTILETMAGLLHSKIDPTEKNHPRRLRLIAQKLGKALNLSLHRLFLLELAATLHDVGKLYLPSHIVSKPDKLTDEERELIRKHPLYSEQLLQNSGLPENIALWVRWHHERYDGNGYPDQRSFDEIPLEAQIIAVAETLDTLLSERPYKPPLSFDEAIEIIRQERGKQFSPTVIDALEKITDELMQALRTDVPKSEGFITSSE